MSKPNTDPRLTPEMLAQLDRLAALAPNPTLVVTMELEPAYA